MTRRAFNPLVRSHLLSFRLWEGEGWKWEERVCSPVREGGMEGGRRSPVEDGGVADEHKPLFASLHPLLKGGKPGEVTPSQPSPPL